MFILALLLKIRYFIQIKNLKKRNPSMSSNQALGSILDNKSKQLKKLKFKSRALTVYIVIQLIISIIAILIVITMLLQFMTMLGNVAGLVSMDFFYEPKYDEEGNIIGDTWDWTDTWEDYWDDLFGNSGAGDSDYDDTSGGIAGYPKDPVLKLKAQYIEIANSVTKQLNVPIDAAWLIGVGSRESGQVYKFNVNNADMYKNLTMLSSYCGQGSSCKWLKSGHSHIIGGSVVGGKDNGSPFTNAFDTTESTYWNMGGNHAIGPYQFEILYLYNSICRYKFGDTKEYNTPEYDKQLEFMRPNPLYIPDAMLCNAKLHEKHWNKAVSESSILRSSEFKSLSEKNQNIIKFSLAGSMYGTGGWESWMDDFASQLVKVAKTKDLDKLLDESKYWDSATMSIKMSGHAQTIADFQAAGINWHYEQYYSGIANKDTHFPWSGLQAVNLGRIEYDKLIPIIQAAEKDNSISGGFGGVGGGLYVPVRKTADYTPTIVFQYGIFSAPGTSPWGYGNVHQGIDISGAGAKGQPIYTVCDAVVQSANSDYRVKGGSAAGNTVIFQTKINGEVIDIQYMHMQSPPFITKENKTTGKMEPVLLANMIGQTIPANTMIGHIGNSGNTSGGANSGYHLHFEVRTASEQLKIKGDNTTQVAGFKNSIPPFPSIYGINNYNKAFSDYAITDTLGFKSDNEKVNWLNKSIYSLAVKRE